MPDYRITTRAVSKETFSQLCDDMKAFANHAAQHASVISNPRFVGGYFTITIDVSLPQHWLTHLNIEVVP